MDAYEHLRKLPLMLVLDALLGEQTWKARKNGTEWYGACPIHQARRNQTSFSFDDAGKFHCFSCGAKGRGCLDLVMAIRKVNFREAVSQLEELRPKLTGGLQRTEKGFTESIEPAANHENPLFKGTYEKFKVESAWLKARGFSTDILDRFGVFEYRNDSRRSAYNGSVLLKVRRYSDGECVGYLSRNIGEIIPEKPKYRFPAGLQKSLELFGAWNLKNEGPAQLPLRVVYLVESPFSVLKFAQLGLPAVSPFGWSVSQPQAAILACLAKGCIYLPDADKRQEAMQVAGQLSQHLWVKMPELPSGVSDPEQLQLEQIRQMA